MLTGFIGTKIVEVKAAYGEMVKEARADSSADYRLLYLALVFLLLFMAILTITLLYERQKNKLWTGSRNYSGKQRPSDRLYLSFYHFLNQFPLTRGYIEKISYRYRLISPCDSRVIAKMTVTLCLISWITGIGVFLMVYLSNPNRNTLVTAAFAVVIFNAEVAGRMFKILEVRLLQETERFIADVEHNFYIQYRVDDAIYRSRDNLSPNMKLISDQIYQLLLSEDKEEALREYYENIPNRYLKAFVSQCVGVMERGDQLVNGKNLFIRNLENLQRELDIEIEKLQRLNMEFVGVILCVVSPVFCIDLVKRFMISMKENMTTFYYGKEGFLMDLALLFLISFIYVVMRKSAEYTVFRQSRHRFLYHIDRIPFIRKAMDNYSDKYASKLERLRRELRNNGNNITPRHFILRSYLFAVMALILGVATICYLHHTSREQLLYADPAEVEALTSAAKESQYEEMGRIIETCMAGYAAQFKDKNASDKTIHMPETREELVKALKEKGTLVQKVILEALADEIYRRMEKYKKEHFSFPDLAVCLMIAAVTYYVPALLLKYNSAVSKDAMEDEVNQFHALISMLMYIDSMTVKQILEELESFAVVFKQSLRCCVNDYSSGSMKALEELKEKEPFERFNRIVDNLIRCDDIPMDQAFHEVDVERDGYISKRKLANEKSIRKRATRAYLLAALPFALLFAYGLVPTLLASMNEINELLEELNGSAW